MSGNDQIQMTNDQLPRQRSRRVDQVRREFVEWVAVHEQQLHVQWEAACSAEQWMRAMGLALRLDELSVIKSQILAMTR